MYKTTILLISFFFFSINLYCQKITLNELISLTKMNFDEFDTYVTNKNYIYYKADSDNRFKSISYAFDESYLTNKARFYIAKYEYFNDSKAVSYQFDLSQYYTSIKKELINSGFKFISEKNVKGEQNFKYQKGNIKVHIWILRDAENSLGVESTYYEISTTIDY